MKKITVFAVAGGLSLIAGVVAGIVKRSNDKCREAEEEIAIAKQVTDEAEKYIVEAKDALDLSKRVLEFYIRSKGFDPDDLYFDEFDDDELDDLDFDDDLDDGEDEGCSGCDAEEKCCEYAERIIKELEEGTFNV